MKKIKFMADYECSPLWHLDSDEAGDIDPADLPISKKLQDDLMAWAEWYDSTLDQDYPPDSKFKSREEKNNFIHQGRLLAQRLQDELGDNFQVVVREPITTLAYQS